MPGTAAPAPARLADLYAAHLRARPGDTALIDEAGALTYRDFHHLCQRAAQWLAAQGIGPGDKVAVWLANRREWLALLFGLAQRGATLVAINTRYRSAELEYILARSRARMLLMQPSFRKIDFPAVLAGVDPAALPDLECIALVDPGSAAPAPVCGRRTVAFDPDDPAVAAATPADAADPAREVILFTTSGTTKGPKLVMHSAATLAAHTRCVAASYGLREPDARLLAALPLCGVFGLNGALAALEAGAPIVMMDLFDAPRAARLLREERITHLFGSDEMLRRIADEAPGARPFPDARVFGFATFSPGAVELVERLQQRGLPLRGLYGSSEVQALFALQAAGLPVAERALGGGCPAAGAAAQVRVRDPASGAPCRPGEQGEIEIRAPGNFIGYLDNPDATAQAITPDGYFRTGDLGYLRPDGSFVYLARMGDALRLGGYLVDPAEIEHALARQPGVRNAQVVGIELDGQPRAAAFVIAEPGATPEALLAPLRAALAPFKVPARLWLVDEFPTAASANGFKIQRARLRQMAEERLQQETPA
ncbi:AMP-binding protein [Bordetella petrii]|uniref:Long-chain-fatty-acid--CoA ligase n=1 Tax=Bordetella petrii TaxID=94624 RepID=A0ABT7W480_9BORD|nr:AMP-binding protein [Bordetella petrii]MDM9560008.1 AMP-binding protein [Bordetella petrii]